MAAKAEPTGAEKYRAHQAWENIERTREAIDTRRYADPHAEAGRLRVAAILEAAILSKDNPTSGLYDDVLDSIAEVVNGLPPEEGAFRRWNQTDVLAGLVRQLPGPPPAKLAARYVAVLDEAVAAKSEELAGLREEAARLSKNIEVQQSELANLEKRVTTERDRVTAASASIQQTVEAAEERLNGEWANRLDEWANVRDRKDSELDARLADQVTLLARAAQVGQRLVEHAAGMHTALDWAGRATRERRTGRSMRLSAISVFALAVAIGGMIVWNAITTGFDLTVGDGILRAGVVLTVAGAGGYLAAESRRHHREADTAEEVAAALVAIEPFYAGASDGERADARRAVGDTVFVKNVLSRFTHRDAAKHAAGADLTSQQLNEVIEALSKSVEVGKKTGG